MKLLDLRKSLKTEFAQSEIDEEDADFIIAEVIDEPVTMLPLIDEIDNNQYEKILKFAEMRKQHIPVNKIFKHAYFFGLDFKINNFVLAPRPESELLVETALKYIRENNFKTVSYQNRDQEFPSGLAIKDPALSLLWLGLLLWHGFIP